ncbi:histidine kinase [Alteromonas sediminis]|uniref:Histidine kinase n=1 Tax=Alteromonas sediminis TaxID=2259342 RepID=A0A3N5ZAM8_9ALTE|nr:sensor histidine kinase [Alteromonas sediminis]RPJ66568.1 histidine kinase [Alteromonas sediminis]
MSQVSKHPLIAQISKHLVPQLALLAAVLFLSTEFMLMQQSSDGVFFVITVLQLTLETLPLFAAHLWLVHNSGIKAWSGWLATFMLYSLVWNIFTENNVSFSQWTLLSFEGWLLIAMASLGYQIPHYLVKKKRSDNMSLLSKLLSLDGVIVTLTVLWALGIAAVFNSTPDAVNNQPIALRIDLGRIVTQFGSFIDYLWQFMVIGSTVLCVYGVNRYVLIRKILTHHGVYAFCASSFIAIIVLTPILANVVLLLPMNLDTWTFLPSENYNPFDTLNFQVCFALMAVTTPAILAFERQFQDRQMAQIAQHQIETELKLLQQQINPHFLFNTLNNLYALTLTKSEHAPDMIMRLANLLRYTVYEGSKNEVPLQQELDYLNDYLALQQIRSGGKCQVQISLPDKTARWALPPLLLIIVLENAFKHGVEPSDHLIHIEVNIQVNEGRLIFCCKNDLPNTRPHTQPGIGLANLRRRLQLLFPDNHALTSQRIDDKWVTYLEMELKEC